MQCEDKNIGLYWTFFCELRLVVFTFNSGTFRAKSTCFVFQIQLTLTLDHYQLVKPAICRQMTMTCFFQSHECNSKIEICLLMRKRCKEINSRVHS